MLDGDTAIISSRMIHMPPYLVQAHSERPDFRLVIAFLWHDSFNVDTDGDSHNPASRTWTQLYIRNRQDNAEVVDIYPAQVTPLILCVESPREYLAARAAFFLAEYMSADLAKSEDGPFLHPETIRDAVGDSFDIAEAVRRVKSSPFAKSTLSDPYPNLR